MTEPDWNFEQDPGQDVEDETGVNLRAYFDQMPDAKMRTYAPSMTDEELEAWDGNFTDEGDLLIPCSESSDVDIQRYREVLEQAMAYRDRVRASLS